MASAYDPIAQVDPARIEGLRALRHASRNDRLHDRGIQGFVIVQTDCAVKLRSRLPPLDELVRSAVTSNRGVKLGLCLVGHSQGRDRPNHHRKPIASNSEAVKNGVRPNSVMLASKGTPGMRWANARNNSAVLSASGKIASAPASM